ncbi:DUF2304 domain-containing protein [Nocardioides sp. GCM10027113]|uniref:DUF2304 domain-containing protein n=1 Tax=unclassified Nocardioides TaxID=2615069 RepID=UPI00361B8A11
MIVKILLIASVAVTAVWLLRGSRRGGRLAISRLAGLTFAAGWVIAVIAPDSVTRMANVVGVGRGADLLLYVLVVAFMFTSAALHQHVRRLNDSIAELTRSHALLAHEVRNAQPEHESER